MPSRFVRETRNRPGRNASRNPGGSTRRASTETNPSRKEREADRVSPPSSDTSASTAYMYVRSFELLPSLSSAAGVKATSKDPSGFKGETPEATVCARAAGLPVHDQDDHQKYCGVRVTRQRTEPVATGRPK